jgi:hypothetical protein
LESKRGRGGGERVWEGEYTISTICKYLLKVFQEWGKGIKGECFAGVNSNMTYLIYCKNFFTCHKVPLSQQLKKILTKPKKKKRNLKQMVVFITLL